MKFLGEEIIQQIKDQNDIVDVVSNYISLQKKGSTYFGTCPFHNEKTPSFSVSQIKQHYFCYGCGEGGDVIEFIRKYNQLSFEEAVSFLAKNAGLEYLLEEEVQEKKPKRILLTKEEKKLLGVSSENRSYTVIGMSYTPPKKKKIVEKSENGCVFGEKIRDPLGKMLPNKEMQKEFFLMRCADLIKICCEDIQHQKQYSENVEGPEKLLSDIVLDEMKKKKNKLNRLYQKIARA